MERLVTSRGLSEELKDLGVKQESMFYWHLNKIKNTYFISEYYHISKPNEAERICSAFLSGELGEILPKRISFSADKSKELGYSSIELRVAWLGCSGTSHHGESCNTRVQKCAWDIYYKPFHVVGGVKEDTFIYWEQGNTEAEARGLMYKYLIKQGLVKV